MPLLTLAERRPESAEPPADGIVGQSAAIRLALEEARLVAAATTPVLLEGETGTGKELFARLIHRHGARAGRPLVTLNCAALPAALIESELFGHERGAFTGAVQRRAGCFAQANGGTLFLDEIGELPLELQAKLLRALQNGEISPVGASAVTRVDVRIIAATNRVLADEVAAGRFRADLYYRLSIFPLRLPPLRERVEDIPMLAAALLDRLEQRLGRSFARLTPDCSRKLQAYSWPGNVRELEGVLERAALTARGDRLNLDRALPGPARAALEDSSAPGKDEPIFTAQQLLAFERRNTLRALERAGWRVAGELGAAHMLGVPASTLSSRMKALGIVRPRELLTARCSLSVR